MNAYFALHGDDDDVVGLLEDAVLDAPAAAKDHVVQHLGQRPLEALGLESLQDDLGSLGVALDVDDLFRELEGERVDECGYFGGEGEGEGVFAVVGDDGGVEAVGLLGLDGLLGVGGVGLVVAGQGHQRLVLVLVVLLQLRWVHYLKYIEQRLKGWLDRGNCYW